MMEEKIFFTTSDGLKLCGILHSAKTPSSKIILLLPGLAYDKDEDDNIFIYLARYFAKYNFNVLRIDFRAVGESEGKSIDITITGELEDLRAAVKEVKKRGFKQIGILGTSFGGGIATLYTAREQGVLKCLLLWNPCLNYDHTFINPMTKWLHSRKDEIKKDLQKKGWTIIGSKNFVVGKGLFEEMKNLFPYEDLKKIIIPTVIIHGDKDNFVPYKDSKEYVNNLKGPHELITITGAEHGFHDDKELGKKANEESLKFFQKNL